MQVAGIIIISIGIGFMLLGTIGIFRFKNFYARIIVAPIIDTVGAFAFILGIAVMHGFSFFSLKLFLLVGLMMVINPLIAHIVAHAAYISGYEAKDNDANNNEDAV